MTPRYVLGLVGQLPPHAAVHAAKRGSQEWRSWDSHMYLLAAITNLLNAANRQRAGKRTNAPVVSPPKRKRTTARLTVAEIAQRQQARKNT